MRMLGWLVVKETSDRCHFHNMLGPEALLKLRRCSDEGSLMRGSTPPLGFDGDLLVPRWFSSLKARN